MTLTVGLSLYYKSNLKYFKECVESIYHYQKLKPNRIFITFDGNVNIEIQKLVAYYIRNGLPITIHKNKSNIGLTKCLNQMITKCDTKYFARMDTDDISESERFYKQVMFLEKNQSIDILGSCGIDIDNNNVMLSFRNVPTEFNNIRKMLPFFNPLIHPSVMFRTKSLQKIGGYDIKYRTSQDYALWYEAISKGLKIHNLSETLLRYRIDHSYQERKSWNYRWNDVLIKWRGIPKISRNKFIRIYALIPIIVFLIPNNLFKTFKKIDPRNL